MSVLDGLSVTELAQRLTDAEALIEALIGGQVDAVVVSGGSTPVLLTKAQEALRESEERLRMERDRAQGYLDTAEVMLLALDLDGRITLLNRYACNVLEWTSREMLGRDWIEVGIPCRMRGEVRNMFRAMFGGELLCAEYTILTKSGAERFDRVAQHAAEGSRRPGYWPTQFRHRYHGPQAG